MVFPFLLVLVMVRVVMAGCPDNEPGCYSLKKCPSQNGVGVCGSVAANFSSHVVEAYDVLECQGRGDEPNDKTCDLDNTINANCLKIETFVGSTTCEAAFSQGFFITRVNEPCDSSESCE